MGHRQARDCGPSSPERADVRAPWERPRRPLDETMLFRLVLASGLVRGPDLVRFYYREMERPGGPRPLEEILRRRGVEAGRIQSLKRAYVETRDLGSELVACVGERAAGRLRAARIEKELGACETEQLLRLRRGEPAAPIGEMLVRRGLITERELSQALARQGLFERAERYAAGPGGESSAAARLGLARMRRSLPAVLAAAGLLLAAAAYGSLWAAGFPGRPPDRFGAARGEDEHVRNLAAIYEGMLDEIRLGRIAEAEACRGRVREYLRRLSAAGIRLRAPEAARIERACGALDFRRLGVVNPDDLPRMSGEELEAALLAEGEQR